MAKIATIALYAGHINHSETIGADKWHLCDGTLMNINSDTLLSIALGTKYGVNSYSFALPNLPNKGLDKMLHTSKSNAPEMYLPYVISTDGDFNMALTYEVDFSEVNLVGLVVPFEGDSIPDGWERCNGKVMKIGDNPMLTATLHTSFHINREEIMLPNTGVDKYIICTRGRM